ncbi:MAG: DUF3267 domain-containing protein [Bacteroidales bacterium]|nr:DUF3267 domain-containing protein [Bacteroidales bacterium]
MRTKQAEPIPSVVGCEPELKTVSIMKANLISIPFLFVVGGLSGWIYYKVWHTFEWNGMENALWMFVAIVVGIVVHELIHGLTWMAVTRQSFKHLSFGTMSGAVYCHIDVPMKKRPYIIGAVMPLLLLGVIPTVVSMVVGSTFWLVFGVIFIVCAIGDIMIMWIIRREPSDTLIYDHPTEAGCVVYRRVSE